MFCTPTTGSVHVTWCFEPKKFSEPNGCQKNGYRYFFSADVLNWLSNCLYECFHLVSTSSTTIQTVPFRQNGSFSKDKSHIIPRLPETVPILRTSRCTGQKTWTLNAIFQPICRWATSHKSNSTYVLLFISCLPESLSTFNLFYSLIYLTTRSVLWIVDWKTICKINVFKFLHSHHYNSYTLMKSLLKWMNESSCCVGGCPSK